MKKKLLLLLLLINNAVVFANIDSIIVPIYRQRAHDRIIEEQNNLDKADGKTDGLIKATVNPEINLAITDAMTRKVNLLREFIELNKEIATDNEKKKYLKYIENLVEKFRVHWKTRQINPVYAPQLVESFERIMKDQIDGKSMLGYIKTLSYEIAKINTDVFLDNKGYVESKKLLYLKFCTLYPDKILQTIQPFVKQPFADSLIVISCKYNPIGIYSAAQASGSVISKLILRNNSPIVKTVVELSKMPNALLYFPFLDEIIKDDKMIGKIKKHLGTDIDYYDSVGYYKLLVQTAIHYSKRMLRKDTPIAVYGTNGLLYMLKTKAIQHFITPINELHDKPESVRMRAVEPLSSIDLYYMLIMGENEIYTSSYKHSFNRLVQRLGKQPRTDSLLMAINFDHFKKFIKMAASYNKLDDFLSLMPNASSEKLMKEFVDKLETTGSLEDAVDVADAYSSITNKELLKNMLRYVAENEQRCIDENNESGKAIYGLLKLIFLSADSINKVDLTQRVGIPSIYSVDHSYLADENGRIIEQVFFYGDEDGKNVFNGFVNSFDRTKWQVEMKKEWVEIKSIKGQKVWIYANRPLDSDRNLDDSAQRHLNQYLSRNDLHPAVVIHRGHSYWLDGTIKRMQGDAKIVVLGSCGGYKNLNKILEINPDAHIISTKEIGKGDINKPILNYLHENFIADKSLLWRNMWATLTKDFSSRGYEMKEAWESYTPPYKNLGAIFIKAYNKKIGEE